MQIPPSGVPPIDMTGTADAKKPADLKKACQQFESYFLNLMLKEMRKTVPKDTLLKDDADQEQTFQEMMDQKVSDAMSERGDFGLATMMYAQLSRSDVLPPEDSSSASPKANAGESAGKSPAQPKAEASKTRQ